MNDLATFVRSTENTTTIGKVFDTPIIVKGKTWFPLTELITWGMMTFVDRRKRPNRSWPEHLSSGVLNMAVILGSEWCHNLAHAAAARRVGKPADAIRITFGMPVLIYPTPEDPSVTPRQHLVRSLAGPAFNGLLLLMASIVHRFTRPNTPGRMAADTAVGTNLFLSTAALTPNPGIDGGPTLKWALVESGKTPQEADFLVKQSNKFVGMGLASAAILAFVKQRRFLAFILGILSLISLDYGFSKHEQ